LETWVAVGFGVYYGVTAGPPWARTIGGIIIVAITLAIVGFWMTVRRGRDYARRGILPEYRPVTLSKAIISLGFLLFVNVALIWSVAAAVYGIMLLVR
jgi:hypothetical protein